MTETIIFFIWLTLYGILTNDDKLTSKGAEK
jgi:hypothetical protein